MRPACLISYIGEVHKDIAGVQFADAAYQFVRCSRANRTSLKPCH